MDPGDGLLRPTTSQSKVVPSSPGGWLRHGPWLHAVLGKIAEGPEIAGLKEDICSKM